MAKGRAARKATAISRELDFEYRPGESVGYLIRDTYRTFAKILQARIATEGVTIGMWYFLRALWEEEGLTQRELSRRIRMMEPTTVSALALMERRGIVWRERDPNDRRRSLVYLTERGRALKSKLLPFALEANVIALTGVPEADVEQLRRIMQRVKQNLDRAVEAENGVPTPLLEDDAAADQVEPD